jgi:hypothetical protein
VLSTNPLCPSHPPRSTNDWCARAVLQATHVCRRAVIPGFTAAQLYKIVADVPSYKQFVPWVVGSRIVRRESVRVRGGDHTLRSAALHSASPLPFPRHFTALGIRGDTSARARVVRPARGLVPVALLYAVEPPCWLRGLFPPFPCSCGARRGGGCKPCFSGALAVHASPLLLVCSGCSCRAMGYAGLVDGLDGEWPPDVR